MTHLYGISGQEEYQALEQLKKENLQLFWDRVVEAWQTQQDMSDAEKEEYLQAIGEI